jgi:hypothetical protein
MNTRCACGGVFRRTDIVQSGSIRLSNGQTVPTYQDTDNQKANWKCTGCGMTRTQRKRQPRQRPSWNRWHEKHEFDIQAD